MRGKIFTRVILSLVLSAVVMPMAADIAQAIEWNFSRSPHYRWVRVRGRWVWNQDPITKVYWFPSQYAVDTTIAPEWITPSGSGTWTAHFVYTDPLGGDRPLGGVMWSTTGPGLDLTVAGEATFSASSTSDTWDNSNYLYTYDSLTSSYTLFVGPTTIPEPSGVVALGVGLMGMTALWRRARHH